MQQQTQIDLIQRSLALCEQRSTDMAATVFRNPASDYTCPEQFNQELQQLFRQHPILVGLSGDIPHPGDWFTFDIAGIPLLISRAEDGQLHAFLNMCRHRGMRVAEGKGGEGKRFVCPYHAWAYGLDGALVARPFEQGFAECSRDSMGLQVVPLLEYHGLIFVRPTPGEAIDVDTVLAGLQDDIKAFGLQDYVPFETREQQRDMNWKLGVDTFLEAYHIHYLHSETIKPMFQNNRALFDAYGRNARLVAIRETMDSLRDTPEQEWSLLPHGTLIYQLFPNSVLIYQLDHAELYQLFPDTKEPGKSRARLTLYAPEPVSNDSAVRHWQRNIDLVDEVTSIEDFTACEAIQRSCATGLQDHLLFGRNEPGLIHYHRTLRSELGLAV